MLAWWLGSTTSPPGHERAHRTEKGVTRERERGRHACGPKRSTSTPRLALRQNPSAHRRERAASDESCGTTTGALAPSRGKALKPRRRRCWGTRPGYGRRPRGAGAGFRGRHSTSVRLRVAASTSWTAGRWRLGAAFPSRFPSWIARLWEDSSQNGRRGTAWAGTAGCRARMLGAAWKPGTSPTGRWRPQMEKELTALSPPSRRLAISAQVGPGLPHLACPVTDEPLTTPHGQTPLSESPEGFQMRHAKSGKWRADALSSQLWFLFSLYEYIQCSLWEV